MLLEEPKGKIGNSAYSLMPICSSFSSLEKRGTQYYIKLRCVEGSLKIRDTVRGGSVLASGTQPPASVTHFFSGQKLLSGTNRQTESSIAAANCLKIIPHQIIPKVEQFYSNSGQTVSLNIVQIIR